MPINGPRPRPGGPGEVNLGMYHDRPRGTGYAGAGAGGGIAMPDFDTFWKATGGKMFGGQGPQQLPEQYKRMTGSVQRPAGYARGGSVRKRKIPRQALDQPDTPGTPEDPNYPGIPLVQPTRRPQLPALEPEPESAPNPQAVNRALKDLNYADMPLGGPIAGPGPMAPIVPGDRRTPEMKRLNYADMPLGGPMARGGPVRSGYANGGEVENPEFYQPQELQALTKAKDYGYEDPNTERAMAARTGSWPTDEYAGGGAVVPKDYSGYTPIRSDPVARRKFSAKRVGYAEGGDIEMPEAQPAAAPDIAGYVEGANAMDPQELDAVLQQIAQLDPNQSEDAVNLTAIVQAAQSGDMERASSILAGFRKRFDSLNAHAQGAAAHGDLAAAAQLAGKAHSQVPDGLQVSYAVGADGNSVTATVTPSGQTFQLDGQQFHDYLVGPATSFDHILENGLEQNLTIASGGQQGGQQAPLQNPAPTGFAAGGEEPRGYALGGTVEEESFGTYQLAGGGEDFQQQEQDRIRQRAEELARQQAETARQQREAEEASRPQQTVKDVLAHTRQSYGLGGDRDSPVQSNIGFEDPATGYYGTEDVDSNIGAGARTLAGAGRDAGAAFNEPEIGARARTMAGAGRDTGIATDDELGAGARTLAGAGMDADAPGVGARALAGAGQDAAGVPRPDSRRTDVAGRPIGPALDEAVPAAAAAEPSQRYDTEGRPIGGVSGRSGGLEFTQGQPVSVSRPPRRQMEGGTMMFGAKREPLREGPPPTSDDTRPYAVRIVDPLNRGHLGEPYSYRSASGKLFHYLPHKPGYEPSPIVREQMDAEQRAKGRPGLPRLTEEQNRALPATRGPDVAIPGSDTPGFRVPSGTMIPDRLMEHYQLMPAEDSSRGQIAVPKGVAPGMKDVVKYDINGNEVPMQMPSYWDPAKVRYENPYGRQSGRELYDQPPGQPAGVRRPDARTVGETANLPASAEGTSNAEPRWQPPMGRETVPRPPDSDTSPPAEAYRLHPGTSGGVGVDPREPRVIRGPKGQTTVVPGSPGSPGPRQAAQQGLEKQAAAERKVETTTQGKLAVAEQRDATKRAIAAEQEAGRNSRADMRHQDRVDNLKWLQDKSTRDLETKIFNEASQQIMTTARRKLETGEPLSTPEQNHYNHLLEETRLRGMPSPRAYDGSQPAASIRTTPAAAPATAPTTNGGATQTYKPVIKDGRPGRAVPNPAKPGTFYFLPD